MRTDTTPARESLFAGVDEESPSSRRRTWLIAVVVVLVVLGGYAATSWSLGDRVPPGATVAGVDIGGLGRDAAVDRLHAGLDGPATDPVPVVLADSETSLDPQAAGLEVDVAATVDRLTGLSFDPRVVLGHLTGMGDVEPVMRTDDDALRAELARLAPGVEVEPVDGAVELGDGDYEVGEALPGLALDVDAAMEPVAEQWLTGPHPIELPGTEVAPDITAEAVDTAVREIAQPLTSAPVTVEVGEHLIELAPEDLTAVAALSPADGALSLALDGERLVELVIEREPEIGTPARDARIVIEDGSPTIEPHSAGVNIDGESLVSAVAAAAVSVTDRTASAEAQEVEPAFTTADADALGVDEVVAEFSTPFHHDPARTENLRVGAGHITGTLVRPGDTFSLIEALGPITAERGYVPSGVVVDGLEGEGMGGGLSQVSTTVFNAAYFAGMELVQFQTHSHHYPRYPEGREATLYTPDVDLRWENTTPHGALVQAWVSGDRFHVRLWGTEHFDVSSSTSDRYDFTEPSTVYNSADTCVPHNSPERGFTVTVTREITLQGEQVAGNTLTTTYIPWDRVVCGPAPGDD